MAAVAFCAFLPFARGLLAGESFYFRDLSRQFLPLRELVADGLGLGELRAWNPYSHEGEALLLPALGYPIDLLQAAAPTPWGISLLLALHGPVAALSMFLLARGGGLGRLAAAAAALTYSLGGFFLACLNLYVYFETMAWAPLVVLTLVRAGEGGRRQVAAAAAVTALMLSTTGVEIALQALLFGGVLALGAGAAARAGRVCAAAVLGAGLSAFVLWPLGALVQGSARETGFDTSVVLAHSVHPVTFLQVVIGGLYGDLFRLADRFWGQSFFPLGFPYVASLYLGATALALAGLGAGSDHRWARRALLLAAVAVLACLGRFAGLAPLVDALPWLRKFRFPTKAFFTVHLAVSLLAGIGVAKLAQQGRRAFRRLAACSLAPGITLAMAPLLPLVAPGLLGRLLATLLPPELVGGARIGAAAHVLGDAAMGGILAVLVGLLAGAAGWGRLRPALAVVGVVALLGVDLLRTGAGLNPTVTPAFHRLSPETAALVRELRAEGGRVFTCEPSFSLAYHRARAARPAGHEVWTFAVNHEILSPYFNVPARVPSALTRDLTMLVPSERVSAPEQAACTDLDRLLPRLRRAGVTHLLSLDPLSHDDLRLDERLTPARIAPLGLNVYALRDPIPLRALARRARPAADRVAAETMAATPGFLDAGEAAIEGLAAPLVSGSGHVVSLREGTDRVELKAETDTTAVLVVRDAYADGWRAWVDGDPAELLRADGRHRAVRVPPGRSHVVLAYRPPGLLPGLAVSLLAACLTLALARSGRRTVGGGPAHQPPPVGPDVASEGAGSGGSGGGSPPLDSGDRIHFGRRVRIDLAGGAPLGCPVHEAPIVWSSSRSSRRASPPLGCRGSLSRRSRADR